MILNSSLIRYIQAFGRLNCDNSKYLGIAPHKPVLLLAVLRLYEENLIQNNEITPSPDLEAMFKQEWHAYVRSGHRLRLAMPFYHMKNEPFWYLNIYVGYEADAADKSKMRYLSSLRKAVRYAVIDNELCLLMQDAAFREVLSNFLINRYFHQQEPDSPECINETSVAKSDVITEAVSDGQNRLNEYLAA